MVRVPNAPLSRTAVALVAVGSDMGLLVCTTRISVLWEATDGAGRASASRRSRPSIEAVGTSGAARGAFGFRWPLPRTGRDRRRVMRWRARRWHGVGSVSYTHLTLPTKRIV